jgi:hypothetical protein
MSSSIKRRAQTPKLKTISIAAATVAALASTGAYAFSIDTGNPDIDMRLDTTVRYNFGIRAEGVNDDVVNAYGQQKSDNKFQSGQAVTNRLDLMSEFDFVYKGDTGFRISGAGWYDNAYSDHWDMTNYVRRYNTGPSAQLLDAFAFTTVHAGDVPISMKLGQHNIYWGESLFTLANGVAYAQGPIDIRKALANPGTEAKELFLPQAQFTFTSQLTDIWSIAGQVGLDWKPSQLPDGGTYFGSSDFFTLGGGTEVMPGLPFIGIGQKGQNLAGDVGLMSKFSPSWLGGGTGGVYYRRFSEKLPWFGVTPEGVAQLNYAQKTQLIGLSYSTDIEGVSVGSELSYRHNTALNSSSFGADGQGARGDTLHALVNAVAFVPKTPLFDSASISAEVSYQHLMSVTQHPELFNGVGYAGCTSASGKWGGCSTKSAADFNISVQPVWYQVMPGVDLKMPLVYSTGLAGNMPALGGTNQGAGSYSVGLRAEVKNQYFWNLAYNGYFGHINQYGVANGAQYADRNWVSLTFTTSF